MALEELVDICRESVLSSIEVVEHRLHRLWPYAIFLPNTPQTRLRSNWNDGGAIPECHFGQDIRSCREVG